MNKVSLIILTSLTSLPAYAGSDPEVVLQLLFKILFGTSILIMFFLFIRIATKAKETLFNKDDLQRTGYRPMTVTKFFLGIALTFGLFWQPATIMNLFNDVTGVGDVCLVTDIDKLPRSGRAVKDVLGTGCFDQFKKDLGDYVEADELDQRRLKLFIGLIQLTGFVFFMYGGVYLIRHIMGEQNLKHSVMASIVILLSSSTVVSVNGLISYVSDLSGKNDVVVST